MAIDQQWAARRAVEVGIIQQMQAQAEELRAAEEAKRQATYAEIEAARAALARGERLPPAHTLNGYFTARRESEVAAEAEAEQARIAALTPRQVKLSTLPFAERQHIARWERINPGMEYPL